MYGCSLFHLDVFEMIPLAKPYACVTIKVVSIKGSKKKKKEGEEKKIT